ncbi:hypothetical protein [Corynebacterium glutamicum]|uniref:hypothetical protein n=1 Tax=Corynebacterium glutamicum TaxID=1718 RepID=UPI0012DA7990|nr:hypothetical protein [Corynebacterium glutamicum]
MMKPFYSRRTPRDVIMAQQNADGTWSTQGLGNHGKSLPDDLFQEMYTDKAPHEYRKRPRAGDLIDPVALAEAGTHELAYVETKEQLDEIAAANPDTWFLDMTNGGAQQRRQMPSVWVGWVNPGEDLMKEENAVYGFPLLAVIPKS